MATLPAALAARISATLVALTNSDGISATKRSMRAIPSTPERNRSGPLPTSPKVWLTTLIHPAFTASISFAEGTNLPSFSSNPSIPPWASTQIAFAPEPGGRVWAEAGRAARAAAAPLAARNSRRCMLSPDPRHRFATRGQPTINPLDSKMASANAPAMEQERIIGGDRRPEDIDAALRPKTLDDFVGQKAARENLRIFIDAARSRGDALDHVLFFGPPGLGKTTLAQIIARELGVGFRATSGPVIAKSGDLAALLTNLEDGDVLFIDEIHRLAPAVEEILYPAMEDRALDLMIGEGPSARSVRIDLPKFTLVGATTRQGLITTPLRDRFGIPIRLSFYSVAELEQVVRRAARLLSANVTEDGAHEVARRSRGTPRIAGRLLRRVRDFAHASGNDTIDAKSADRALDRLEIDGLGLDAMDRRYLLMIADLYGGGPVGVETLAAGLSEPRDTIEDVIEPYLIQLGLIARTARGRCLNGRGWTHLGLAPPAGAQTGLFDVEDGAR